ncbi:MAG: bacterial proteasome activator family protein [Actinomycetes bacterium]
MSQPSSNPEQQSQQVVVVGPDGKPIGAVDLDADGNVAADPDGDRGPAEMIEQPAKVMRIGSMVKQLLEEVRAAPLDEAARERLRDIYASSIRELADGLAPELREELDRLALPFGEDSAPSDAELRIAKAQLVGWLEGLFHGIQTALFAQQMAARVQLEQMRGRQALPGGPAVPPGAASGPQGPSHGTGQYL